MRTQTILSSALISMFIAGCSKQPDSQGQQGARTENVRSETATDSAGPDIPETIAPGVAFDIRYAFSLPETAIAKTQEGHVAQCQQLGIVQCRVTGVAFNKERNGHVKAMTQFKLDPSLALRFGREATSLVERHDGTLETSTLNGEDAGSAIVEGDKTSEGLQTELSKIDAQLRIPGLSQQVRGRLTDESGRIRAKLRTGQTQRNARIESLATTPVQFTYESAAAIGIDAPVRQGLATSTASITAMLSLIAFALGAIGPWAALALIGWLGWRRWRGKKGNVVAAVARSQQG